MVKSEAWLRSPASVLQAAERTQRSNDLEAASRILLKGTKLFPSNLRIRKLHAQVLASSRKIVEALEVLDSLIVDGIADSEAWRLTGELLASVQEFAQAADAYEHSLESCDDANTRHEYGRTLFKLGLPQKAASQFERAIELRDDFHFWRSLSTLAPSNPAYDLSDVARIRAAFASKLKEKEQSQIDPVPEPDKMVLSSASSGNKVRVGYVSAWFHRENYMKPVWALLNSHDRTRFEIHLFADNGVGDSTGFERHAGDQIHDTGDLSNAAIVRAIRNEAIDILVDLNSFSTPDRLGIFCCRAAPVQVAWFNSFATSGLEHMDYLIGDQWTVLSNEEQHYSEAVVRLGQSYLSFVVTHDAPEIVSPPSTENRYITLGSFVPLYKITDPVVSAWSAILKAVSGSRLLMANVLMDSESNRKFLAARFARHGIDENRLEFRGKAPHKEFLQYYDLIDIALDAFPYNGGTTTMEAIWQGVPVITFIGDRWASRTSASILGDSHLTRFVAKDEKEYSRVAIELANHPNRLELLRDIRHTMREKLSASRVCDSKALAVGIEALYEEMLAASATDED